MRVCAVFIILLEKYAAPLVPYLLVQQVKPESYPKTIESITEPYNHNHLR